MATKAFILIETTAGRSQGVAETLSRVEGVDTVDATTGPYDIIAVLEERDLNAVRGLVVSQIHPINGIVRTVTCLAVNEY